MAPPFCPPERSPIWRRLDSACCYARSRCSRQLGGNFAADLAGAAVLNLQSRPEQRREKICRQRPAAMPGATGLLRRLLELVLTVGPVTYLTGAGRRATLAGFNEQPIPGVVSAAGPPWLPDVLHAVAVCCLRMCRGHVYRDTLLPAERIPCACIRALAASGPDACLRALARIGRATSNRAVLTYLATTLKSQHPARDVAGQLAGPAHPHHGLGPGAQRGRLAHGGRAQCRRSGSRVTSCAGRPGPHRTDLDRCGLDCVSPAAGLGVAAAVLRGHGGGARAVTELAARHRDPKTAAMSMANPVPLRTDVGPAAVLRGGGAMCPDPPGPPPGW
jgi:hypothetical protein